MQFVAESRADGLLDPVAVRIIDVARRDTAGHRGQPVLGVVGQRDILTAIEAPGGVAVGVMP